MIRTYTVQDLEVLSGLTRRTIGDYVAKGLLAGPSHRGRGARYSQADADVLRLIPRLRTVLKKDFPNLTALRTFFRQLSTHDLHMLAGKTSESAFIMAVRLLRVRIAVSALLPQVAPERIAQELERLTPEQIHNIDAGRTQLGAVIDLQGLLASEAPRATSHLTQHDQSGYRTTEQQEPATQSGPSWSVNWLDGSVQSGGPWASPLSIANDLDETIPPEIDRLPARHKPRHNARERADLQERRHDEQTERLSDIARRLARLEQLLITS
jgi:DNA-binding transcriptional MerR regulator